jgi:hypothetical protein
VGRVFAKKNDKKKSLLLCPLACDLALSDLRFHTNLHRPAPMAPPNTRARANWAMERATALPEVWALVAEHRGVLGARRLMRVCKAARTGAKDWLSTLPGLVVCGGGASDGIVSDVWRLDMATLRWEPMPALVGARYDHACCVVWKRGRGRRPRRWRWARWWWRRWTWRRRRRWRSRLHLECH